MACPGTILIIMTAEEFKDIAPYANEEFPENIEKLLHDPGFEHAIGYVLPGVNFSQLCDSLRTYSDKESFQKEVMIPILKQLEDGTTDGVTDSGIEDLDLSKSHLFISNHRDIVLDASFLGLAMIRKGIKAPEVALGDNLLIYDWIEHLVRLNKGVIVKRNLRLTKALESAKHLSGYLHYCITEKNESVWIAQREGRAKDSNDVTQESVIKMLALAGNAPDIASRLMELNIVPVAISYEFDPNDYLKASEFLAKERDPEFRKSQHDDLKSMETGILKYKGRVHFSVCKEINPGLEPLIGSTDKAEVIHTACALIDKEIHHGYHLYPVNYYAFDRFEGTDRFSDHYTRKEAAEYAAYFDNQLNQVNLPDVTTEEREFMLRAMLGMYANPLRNQLNSL